MKSLLLIISLKFFNTFKKDLKFLSDQLFKIFLRNITFLRDIL